MIRRSDLFPNADSEPEDRYQRSINQIFDFVRATCRREGLSLQEGLGVLTVVKGSLEINLSMNSQDNCYDLDDCDDEEEGF